MNNSALYATVIAQKTLGYFRSNMGMSRTVTRDFEIEPAQQGETIKVGKRGALQANSKTLGGDVTLQTPAATGTNVTLNSHYEVTFDLEDVVRAKSNESRMRLIEGYASDAASVLLEEVEQALAALYSSISATAIAFDDTSAATKVSSLLQLRKEFVDAKVPATEERFLYLGSNSAMEILEEERFTSASAVGEEAAKAANLDAFVAKRFGFTMLENQNVVSTGTSPSAVEHNIAYTRGAFVLAQRPLALPSDGLGVNASYINDSETGVGLRVLHSYNANKLAEQVTLDVLFGVAIVDQRRVREFELTY